MIHPHSSASSAATQDSCTTKKTPVRRAVALAGGQTELARRLGLRPQSVQQWVANEQIPIKRVPEVAKVLNYQMSVEELCPDYFGR